VTNHVVALLRGRGPSRRPTSADLHWAAGFLEGEGTFAGNGRYHKSPKGISHKVAATQVEPETLWRLREMFGGVVSHARQPDGVRQGIWQWQLSGVRARGVMMTLYSLLSERRRIYIREELARGRWALGPPRQLQCKRGHTRTTENQYVYKGDRHCKVCQRAAQRARRAL